MTRWIPIGTLEDFLPDRPTSVRVNERELVMVRSGERAFLLDGRCPHRGGQLSDGRIEGNDIICSLHGYDFDLETGVSRYDPSERVATYPARVIEGMVEVDADAVPPLPHGHDDGYQARWRRPSDSDLRGYDYLTGLRWGSPSVSPMGTRSALHPSWDDILLLPAQVARPARLEEEPLDLTTVIGRSADQPLALDIPFFISHMSFGALSASAKVALARVAESVGTAIGSGEGGMLPDERAVSSRYIFEMASGYFGWTPENIARASAIEIKFGQSAKAGSGGLLPGPKVTARIAETRGLQAGEPAVSPARFVDIEGPVALRERVSALKEQTRGRPIGIKFAAGRVEDDVEAAVAAGADFITIDGRGGGTGASPDVLKDHLTIPIQYALPRARKHLEHLGRPDVDLVATGGFRSAGDIAKALALGARAVAMATASMVAVGCQQYLACHTGNCPVGIATQRPDLEARFDIDRAAEQGAATFQTMVQELGLLGRAVGVRDIHDLAVTDLASLDTELSTHTDIAHA